MIGKYYDELVLGEEFLTPGRTITETDVVMFAALSGDYNELHTNVEYMKTSQFERRIAHGLLILAISHGLIFRLGILEGSGIAFLEVDSWKFISPIYIGDTICVKLKVDAKRPSATKQDRGIVKFFIEVIKQDNMIVQQGIKTIMMKRKLTNN